jgi:hypothetical protein
MPDLGPLGRHRRAGIITAATIIAGILAVALSLPGPRAAHAQSTSSGVRVAIISPANGGGAAGQTLEAGVFAIVNDTSVTLSVPSVTVAFSDPSIFYSASLNGPGVKGGSGAPWSHNVRLLTSPHVNASSTFYFSPAIQIAPGGEPAFALTVTMASSISRNETDGVAYAGMFSPTASGASAPLSLALAIVGLAMAALPGGTRRRATTIAALAILLTLGAPGCGSDNSSPSSTQSVTAVSVSASPSAIPGNNPISVSATVSGLPLRLGVVSWH